MEIFLLASVKIQDAPFKKLTMTVKINNEFCLTSLIWKKAVLHILREGCQLQRGGIGVGVHNLVPKNSGVFTLTCLQWRPWVYTNTAAYNEFQL